MTYEYEFYIKLKLIGFRRIIVLGFGPTLANIHKVTTNTRRMMNNDPRSQTILDINAKHSAAVEKMLMSHLISLLKTISKQGEEVRTLMK